jgi:hypothetical protein
MFDTFPVKNSLQTNKIHRIRKKGNPGTGKKAVSAAYFSIKENGDGSGTATGALPGLHFDVLAVYFL